MSVLLMVMIIVVALVLPMKYMAQYFGAERAGIGSCLIAIALGTAFSIGGQHVHKVIGYLSIFLTAGAYALVLGTTYLKGLGIVVVQVASIAVAALVLAGLGVGTISVAT